MKINILILFVVIFISPFFTFNSHANEWSCTLAYGEAITSTEKAARFAQSNNYCGAADEIEEALNWLGTAEDECAAYPHQRNEVLKLKNQLIPLLTKYVGLCGY